VLAQKLDGEVEQWREWPVEKVFPYLMIDRSYCDNAIRLCAISSIFHLPARR
jgi:hypothetical protein